MLVLKILYKKIIIVSLTKNNNVCENHKNDKECS